MVQYDGQVSNSECDSYLGLSSFDRTTKSYIIKFTPQGFNYPDPASHHYDKNVIRRISFGFAITDPFYPLGGDAQMSAFLFDAESQAVSENSQKYSEAEVNSTVYSNIYTLGKSQIERTIRKFIISSVQNVLIGRPYFVTLPMLSSTYATYPLVNTSSNIYARASVEPSSYIVNTEIEKSNMTLLDVLSALGGMYSLIMAFYGILYGDRAIEPWGLVQKMRHKSVKKFLDKKVKITAWAVKETDTVEDAGTITVVDEQASIADDEQASITNDEQASIADDEQASITDDGGEETMEELKRKLGRLQKRQESLENFLQDYVVNMSFYKKDGIKFPKCLCA
ncbi:6293_t:CDS:2 [Paraglomus brasilianum]|uniref:6293_t:CDS:1 n=1 Tax=Paraglomus brasilianum TaxID=144538 RepID=A0A9N9FQF7_9GLOM|nr:6293_t:CDS:2 [Paraglomus brasilianum]